MIEFNNVSFSYNEVVLKDVNFTVNTGDFFCIIGQNGSGKSTLLKLITQELKPTSGKIIFNNTKIAYIEQITANKDLSFPATIYEIVSLGINKKFKLFLNKEDKELVLKTLKRLDLYKYKDKQLANLSGGEQQKVKIAKALVSGFDTLVMDEPTSGIDKKSEVMLLDLINDLNKNYNKTIIFVSHDTSHFKEHKIWYRVKDQCVTKVRVKNNSEVVEGVKC